MLIIQKYEANLTSVRVMEPHMFNWVKDDSTKVTKDGLLLSILLEVMNE